MRCADVAEKVSVVHPEWLEPHKRVLLSFASTVQEKEVRWHMAQMLPRLELSPSERRRVVALLFKYLEDASQIVKTFSMQALFEISESDARLRARVIPILRAPFGMEAPPLGAGRRSCLPQLIQSLLGLGMAGMLFEQFLEDSPGFFPIALDGVDSGEIQVSLIEAGRNADALFEAAHRFVAPLSSKIQHSAIIQSFRVSGAELQAPAPDIRKRGPVSSICAYTIARL